MRHILLEMTLACAMLASCASNAVSPQPTSTQLVITETPRPTPSETSTAEPPVGVPSATSTSLEGTTSTQVYVRGEPSSASSPLALIGPSSVVQIVGKDPAGNWYQITFPQGQHGLGWVFSKYVDVTDKTAIPVVGADAEAGPIGVIMQQVNVRGGPGTGFDALGTLNAADVVTLVGKDRGGTWLQIKYAPGPDGKGWIAASYVQAGGLDGLSIVAESGDILGTGTPTPVPATATAVIAPAPDDHDSAQSPAINVKFSPDAAGSLIYSSDVSAPKGDAADWVEFTPYGTLVRVSLDCMGNGKLKVELLQNDALVQDWGGLSCGQARTLSLSPGQPYWLHLVAVPAEGPLDYVRFTLSVDGAP